MDTISEELHTARESLLTSRTIDEYLRDFDISLEQLSQLNTVVDLGSGIRQEFARDVKRVGLTTNVISIDPKLALPEEVDIDPEQLTDDEMVKRRIGRRTPQERTIAALAQHLPIKAGSVDTIFASRSVPMYIYDQTNMDTAISEMSRILEHGGEIRMFPVAESNRQMVINAIRKTGALTIIPHNHKHNSLESKLLIARKI